MFPHDILYGHSSAQCKVAVEKLVTLAFVLVTLSLFFSLCCVVHVWYELSVLTLWEIAQFLEVSTNTVNQECNFHWQTSLVFKPML